MKSDDVIVLLDGERVAELSSWSVNIGDEGVYADIEFSGLSAEELSNLDRFEFIHIDDRENRYELTDCYVSSYSVSIDKSIEMTIEAIDYSIREKI